MKLKAVIGRREFLCHTGAGLALAAVAGPVLTGCDAAPRGPRAAPAVTGHAGGRLIVENVDRYRVVEPLFEAVRIVLAHRGERYSPAYIQGISGAAFRVAGICPCAPTCSSAMSPPGLVALLGFEARQISPMEEAHLPAGDADVRFARLMRDDMLPEEAALTEDAHRRIRTAAVAMIEAVKAEINAGRPVIVWHAFTNAENDVVVGYDEATGEFLGRGSYVGNGASYGHARQYRCMRSQLTGGWPGALILGPRVRAWDAAAVERAALVEAVRHAHDQKNVEQAPDGPWALLEGLAAYDRWVASWSKPQKKREAGDSYCHGIYRSTHRAGAAFVREIAPRHPQGRTELLAAGACFAKEADLLDGGEEYLGWKSPEKADAERSVKAADVLRKAREAYAMGIAHLEKALGAGV